MGRGEREEQAAGERVAPTNMGLLASSSSFSSASLCSSSSARRSACTEKMKNH